MKADPSTLDKAPGAGRPRDPRIDSAILAATTELLVDIGYSNLSLAAVAERAGTTKSALYRRWSSKAELVHEAAFPVAPTALLTPAGDFAADIQMMIEAVSAFSKVLSAFCAMRPTGDSEATKRTAISVSGKFHGMIAPTTPIGRLTTRPIAFCDGSGTCRPDGAPEATRPA